MSGRFYSQPPTDSSSQRTVWNRLEKPLTGLLLTVALGLMASTLPPRQTTAPSYRQSAFQPPLHLNELL